MMGLRGVLFKLGMPDGSGGLIHSRCGQHLDPHALVHHWKTGLARNTFQHGDDHVLLSSKMQNLFLQLRQSIFKHGDTWLVVGHKPANISEGNAGAAK